MAKHTWATYADTHPEWCMDSINLFAGLDNGFHNGPKCTTCGLANFCQHCHPETFTSDCKGKN